MDAEGHDLLHKLPAELRVDIYRRALTTSANLERPHESEARRLQRARLSTYMDIECSTFASLLAVSSYIYQEAVDILYGENVFKLELSEVTDFPSSVNFCAVRRIQLVNSEAIIEACSLAQRFMRAAKTHARRTRAKKLKLEEVVVSAHAPTIDDIWALHIKHALDDVDIGLWSIDFGQPFEIHLEDHLLRRSWASIIKLDTPTKKSSPVELITAYQKSIKSAQEVTYAASLHSEIPPGSRLEVLALHAIALDAVRGVGLKGDNWPSLCRAARNLRKDGYESLGSLRPNDQLMHTLIAGHGGGPVRLIDVNAESSMTVLLWANDVLLWIREAVCNY
ncbi:hypothetical protein LTS10_003650 [Elasticomyces elasticus]|nr:hypothetical protein LTS10_003650 [Elasticomyces elasticus]